jgi:uncharacterized protein with HEPN domain
MGEMGDKLVHDYFGVDLGLVWDVVVSELPNARTRITALLDELEGDSQPEA